ncbi:M15 family metallopeptidase, partial [Stomatohabitans albus]|uniref:M15 family metallopeptidase n=1 Tax=Stomatohabitans albus TaxID=3110766 RepID=UPI00300DABFF
MARRGSPGWMAQVWGPPGPHGLATWQLTPDVRVTTKKAAIPAFQRLAAIMNKHGYRIRPGVTGAYNFRRIRGGRGWSNHSWGLALDVNWDKNPMTTPLKTDMPKAMVDEIKAIRTVDGLPVFRWGGDYTGRKDAMHFELMVTPKELARGIAGASPAPRSIQAREDDDMLKHGDRGPAVAKLQMTINGILARSERLHPAHEDVPQIAVDGIWGNDTTRGLTHAHARAQQVCR